MKKSEQTVGVDLDGTLAHWNGWEGPDKIGYPIPKMRERVKRWRKSGVNVVILTARVSPKNGEDAKIAHTAIQKWCQKVFGEVFPVTCEKDPSMIEIWDDRAQQVLQNTGETVLEKSKEAQDKVLRILQQATHPRITKEMLIQQMLKVIQGH